MVGYAATGLAIGACGIVAKDSGTTIVALLGMALGSATLIYWGAAMQLVGVLLLGGIAVGVSYAVADGPGLYWLQLAGTNLPTFAATVYVAFELKRHHLRGVRHHLDRLARENALRESEQRFRAVFETAGIGIALTDPSGRIVANTSLDRMLGYSTGELPGVSYETVSHRTTSSRCERLSARPCRVGGRTSFAA